MKKLLFLVLLLPSLSNTQTNLDSLFGIWNDPSQPDTIRLQTMKIISWDVYLNTNPDSAFYFAQMQYDFAKEKKQKKYMATALNIQGASFELKGDYSQAIDYYFKCLEIYNEIGNKLGIGYSYNNIGNVYRNQGEYEKALENHTKSLRIKEEFGDKEQIASSLNSIGSIYYAQGNFEKAIDYFTTSLKMVEEIGDIEGAAFSYNNIGILYSDQGDFAKAIDYYAKCLKIFEEIDYKIGVAVILNNIGTVFNQQGDYTKALEYLTKALNMFEEIGNKPGSADALNNIGNSYFYQNDMAQAINYYTNSLKIKEEISDKPGVSSALNGLAAIYHFQGQYDKAIDYFTKSLKISEEIGNKEGVALCYANFGVIYQDKKDYAKALEYSNQSLIIAKEVGSSVLIKTDLRELLEAHCRENNSSIALSHLSELRIMLETEIETNFFTLSEQEKQIYFSTLEADYGLYHDFALNYQSEFENITDTSYNIALQNKGITLKSSTAMRQSIQNSGDTVLIKEYEDWLTLRKTIANTNTTDSTYKILQDKANEMERQLVKTSNVFSNFDKVMNLKWQDVQAGLKPNEAAIEFVHFESKIDTASSVIYAALIVKKDSKHPVMVKLCAESDLKEILGNLQGNNLNFVNSVYGTKEKAQTALYEKVWQPMEESLEGIENIYLSPTGLLHKIAFHSISKDKNAYLCDTYNIRLQNSTGNIVLAEEMPFESNQNYLMLGGIQYNSDTSSNEVWSYLPGTLEEANNILSYLKKKKYNITLLTANDAGESSFKTSAPEAHILHIATHGFFFPDPEKVKAELKDNQEYHENLAFRGQHIDPDKMQRGTRYADWNFVKNKNPLMRSGLVLANANDVWQRPVLAEGEDGILTANEVSTLNLNNTNLVILSACETGLGDIKGSEGVYGLQRAFKMAGANYLIMSLWQVPDKETSEFMQLFYQNLIKMKHIPLAFNKTQKTMRMKYDPYYWAAFVLVE